MLRRGCHVLWDQPWPELGEEGSSLCWGDECEWFTRRFSADRSSGRGVEGLARFLPSVSQTTMSPPLTPISFPLHLSAFLELSLPVWFVPILLFELVLPRRVHGFAHPLLLLSSFPQASPRLFSPHLKIILFLSNTTSAWFVSPLPPHRSVASKASGSTLPFSFRFLHTDQPSPKANSCC